MEVGLCCGRASLAHATLICAPPPTPSFNHRPPQRATASRAPDAFELNGQLLALNPDVYTLWNYRRDCVLEREAGA